MCVIDRDAHSRQKIYYRKWKKMKNVFKKAAAAVMAFTLLGAGTTITKSLSKTDNILVASAACQYHHGTVVQGHYIDNARWETQTVKRKQYIKHYEKYWPGCFHTDVMEHTYVYDVQKCRACGGEISRKLVSSSSRVVESHCR